VGPPAAVQAVVFDLDGTLLDRRLSFERFIWNQWERFPFVRESVDRGQYVRSAVEHDRDGYASRKDLSVNVLARFGLPTELSSTLLEDYRDGFPSGCVLFSDAAQTLAALRAAGLKLGLITNGSVRMQRAKLRCLSLEPAFDSVVISEAEGVSKPDPRIFRLALERLRTAPADAMFVGDHPEVDVSGARGAGMRAVWRRDAKVSRTVEADAVIENLADLLQSLELHR